MAISIYLEIRSNLRFLNLKNIFFIWIFFFFFLPESLTADLIRERPVSIRFFEPQFIQTVPGQIVTVKANVVNLSTKRITFVGKIKAPYAWTILPTNNILFTLNSGEVSYQNMTIKIPVQTAPGEYKIVYQIEDRYNPQIRDINFFVISVQSLECDSETQKDDVAKKLLIENQEVFPINSYKPESNHLDVRFSCIENNAMEPGTVVIFSTIIDNPDSSDCSIYRTLILPEDWQIIPKVESEIKLQPNKKHLDVFALKIPENTLAGCYAITTEIEDINHKKENDVFYIIVNAKKELKCQIEKKPSVVACGEEFEVLISQHNFGNVPLFLKLVTRAEPICNKSDQEEILEIGPGKTLEKLIKLKANPDHQCYEQFVYFKVTDQETDHILWQQAATFQAIPKGIPVLDPYVRIPSFFSTSIASQGGKLVFIPEWWGGGVIDPQRDRNLEYDLRIPSDSHNVIYEEYQRYYASIWEPDWDIDLGDTVYELSPLLERWRYGRGAGFNTSRENWATGAFYAQDLYNRRCDFREFGSYLEFYPSELSTFWINYLYKNVPDYPHSNICGLEYEVACGQDNIAHFEYAHDFIDTGCSHGKEGYSVYMRGRYCPDSWYSIEKSYAGHSFFGTYRDLDLFAANLDTGHTPQFRTTLSVNFLHQQLNMHELHRIYSVDPYVITAPRQKQYNAQATYSFLNGFTFALTGLIFHAKDDSYEPQYYFRQRWGGFNLGLSREHDSFLIITSFGEQKNLLNCRKKTNALQTYYFYYSRDISPNFQINLLYDMGNIDYYDAKPWRYGFGASLRYHYGYASWADVFAQKVKMYPDGTDMTQYSANLSHTYANNHNLSFSCQCFTFEHQHNKYQFLLSYTIPFDLPVGRRTDIGGLEGRVFKSGSNEPIPNTLVSLGKHRVLTDNRGMFGFPGVLPGEYDFKTEILPVNMITQENSFKKIPIIGAQNTYIEIPVIGCGKIKGEIYRYAYPEDLESLQSLIDTNDTKLPLIKEKAVAGLRVMIVLEDSEEGYSTLTNSFGAFHFNELRPGKWKFTVIEDGMEQGFCLDLNNFIVELQASREEHLSLKIIPEARVIKKL